MGSRPRVLVIGLVTIALLLGVIGCARTPTDSGVKGLVTIGPTTPVQQQGESGEAPYAATIVVEDSRGRKVAEAHSGADGHYSVNLAPGSYTLVPQSPGVLPRADTYDAVVKAHEFTTVNIQYDSGIR